ncbi:hypothetical protein F2P81_025143 [Scophthalmus maximus]|uniref:K Homology domain-containing protein n=1 Tax=Scophthalmus maximus TaxID=52904 RepID=A0A6A4RQH0_SCOMX|nr:hypothetical protein F2P81_025143 [Scophthalmus maximus]
MTPEPPGYPGEPGEPGEPPTSCPGPSEEQQQPQMREQIVGKMGGEAMSHLNSSSGSVEPSLYYPGQKRPGEDGVIGRGGEQITRIQLESGCKIQIAAV